jgi:hypothetical protein
VNTTLLFAQDVVSSKSLYHLFTAPKRTLGCAILVAAIHDYVGSDDNAHRTAECFLYPKSQEYRQHYDWVVSMAPGVDPQWLRSSLDRSKPKWDQKRFENDSRIRHRTTQHDDIQSPSFTGSQSDLLGDSPVTRHVLSFPNEHTW